jgi:hypothetical protein
MSNAPYLTNADDAKTVAMIGAARRLVMLVTPCVSHTARVALTDGNGIGAAYGTVIPTPNKHRMTTNWRERFWLYMLKQCDTEPRLAVVNGSAGQRRQPARKGGALHSCRQRSMPSGWRADIAIHNKSPHNQ